MAKGNMWSLLASGILLGLVSCSPKLVQQKEKETFSFETLNKIDQAAYALGVSSAASFGEYINQLDSSFSRDLILKGFIAQFKGDSVAIEPSKAHNLLGKYLESKEQERVAGLQAAAEAVLAKYAKDERYKKTESGIYYREIKEGNGTKPTVQDTVKVHYIGKLADGTEFDNSYKRKEAATFPLLQLIPGWTEGICLMPEGATYELIIPSHLGYGERGAGSKIPPYAPLIFEVSLEQVIPYKEVEVKEVKAKKKSSSKR